MALGADVTPGGQIAVVVAASSSISSIGSICSATGGRNGWVSGGLDTWSRPGSGGSGGGFGSSYTYGSNDSNLDQPIVGNCAGGFDGSNGFTKKYTSSGYIDALIDDGNDYGQGQYTTTRYFGESTGTLYSTGGSGEYATRYGSSKPEVKTDNTGDGGDGRNGKGASGICIIRWSGK